MSFPPSLKSKVALGRCEFEQKNKRGRTLQPYPYFSATKKKLAEGVMLSRYTAGRQMVSSLSTFLFLVKLPGHWRKSTELCRIFGEIVCFLRLLCPKFIMDKTLHEPVGTFTVIITNLLKECPHTHVPRVSETKCLGILQPVHTSSSYLE